MLNIDSTDLIKTLKLKIEGAKGKCTTKTVAFFDLVGSTQMKLREGHTVGTRSVLLHNMISREISGKYEGRIVKELGDGVLVSFEDPVSACCAAVEIKTATSLNEATMTKGGLTIGEVEEMEIEGIQDMLGSTVDRCARIEAQAVPNQILLDETLYKVVISFLKDYSNVCISAPKTVNLKSIGPTKIYEISTKQAGLVSWKSIPFSLYDEGRLSIEEKVSFMEDADREIIELGVGLTTFAGYFVSRRESEFKAYVVQLLKRGVDFKCMFLDPDCSLTKDYANDLKDATLVSEIRSSAGILKKLQKEFSDVELKGSLSLLAYSRFPCFHAVCVDPRTDMGRMTVSHYLPDIRRAETPVFQFSRAHNKIMFEKYWQSIEGLLKESKQL